MKTLSKLDRGIIYVITYKPHVDHHSLPCYYIGSKFRWDENQKYIGSVSSNEVFSFTDNKPLRVWWKEEWKRSPENFVFEIVEDLEETSIENLLREEFEYQQWADISRERFFNQAYANGKFFSKPKSEETKEKQSKSLAEFYKTKSGEEKRKQISILNKKIKSSQMKESWASPSENQKKSIALLKDRSTHPRSKPVIFNGILYESVTTAMEKTKVSRYLILKNGELQK